MDGVSTILEWGQFLSHTVDLFLSRSICRFGFLWKPRFWCHLAQRVAGGILASVGAGLQYHGVGVISHRGRGACFGVSMARLQVEFHCDNHAVVAIINSGSSRDPLSMHLMRRLVLVACQFDFSTPLAMSLVVTTQSLIPSLVLTFRTSAGFIPQPTRILPPSLQLSCRRELESQCLAFLCRGLAASSRRTYASGMKKFWSFCALFPDLFPSSPVSMSEYQLMLFVS